MYCFLFHIILTVTFIILNLCSLFYLCDCRFNDSDQLARPRKMRCISGVPVMTGYKPVGIPMRDLLSVTLLYEEMETLRLCDYLGMKQEDAAELMKVSRPTFTRIYEKARRTVATAFAEGRAIIIDRAGL